MTEREARTILFRAAEAGAFDEVVLWWDGEGRPQGMVDELSYYPRDWSAVVSRWITRRASEIATALLGEPFEFPSLLATWITQPAWCEDPLWGTIFGSGGDHEVGDGI